MLWICKTERKKKNMKEITLVAPWNKQTKRDYDYWREQREKLWESIRETLKADWGEEFPDFDELEPKARNMKEAKMQVKANMPLAKLQIKSKGGLTVGDFLFSSKAAQLRKEQR